MATMDRTHPHSDATYRIIQQEDESFAVEVEIPGTYPTTVKPFASTEDAEGWIAKHKEGVASTTSLRRTSFGLRRQR
jgi:hypothetical protein